MPSAPQPLSAPESESGGHRMFSVRPILIALIAVLIGAGVGVTGSAVERRLGGPRIEVTPADGGWRLTSGRSLRFHSADLDGERLVVQDGPFVVLVDLGSGDSRTLAPGPENGATRRPAISDAHVVWFEAPRGEWRADAYTCDLGSGRRRLVAAAVPVASYPDVSGSTAVWTESTGDGAARLAVVDLVSGARRSLAVEDGEPLVDGGLVAYRFRPSASNGGALAAVDLADGRRTPVAAAAPSSTLRISGWAVAGRRVAWCWEDPVSGDSRLLVRDVDTLRETLVASGDGLVGPALDGNVVVWAEPAAGGARVMGSRLGGEGRQVATTDLRVTQVLVSDGLVGWMGEDAGGRSVLEVRRWSP